MYISGKYIIMLSMFASDTPRQRIIVTDIVLTETSDLPMYKCVKWILKDNTKDELENDAH